MQLSFKLNGSDTQWDDVYPGENLLEVLRRHGCWEVKGNNCTNGECGACAILLDGIPVPSCSIFAAKVEGRSVDTIRILGDPDHLHPLQQAFLRHGAVQCGYCIPGMLLSAHALLVRNPHPSREEIQQSLSGHLCRCTGYLQQIEAIEEIARLPEGAQ
jgi:aerobic-type carbon monoxide dehydrogenase small subunit (CoxS/CutS family)